MGRRIRTSVPQVKKLLIPEWSYLKDFRESDKLFKQQQKKNYDKRHWVRSLPSLPSDSPVWINTPMGLESGRIIGPAGQPRSYNVEVRSGEVRRNRAHLRPRSDQDNTENVNVSTESASTTERQGEIRTRSKTGNNPGPPNYFRF